MLNLFRTSLRQLLAAKPRSNRRRKNHICSRPAEVLEDRALLSNVNFLPSGQVIFGGGGGNNSLSVSVVGNTYTYTDPGEIINIIGTNAPGTQSGTGTNTITFDATSVGTALTTLVINTNGGTDSVTITGIRAGAEGLDIRDSVAGDTVNISGSYGTSGSPIASFGVSIAASQINVSAAADINTSNLTVSLSGPVALGAGLAIDAETGAVDINGNVNGASSLTVTGGLVTLDGAIGDTTPLSGLTATSETASGVRIQAAAVNGAVSLTGNAVRTQGTLTGNGSGALSISQFTNGNNLIVQFGTASAFNSDSVTGFSQVNLGNINTGTLTLKNDGDGAVAGTGTFRPGSAVVLTGNSVNVEESIDQSANILTVNVDTTLTWGGQGAAIGTGAVAINKINAGGTLTIQGKMGAGKQQWGANALTVNAAGSTVDFRGEVATNLASFTATASTLLFGNVPFGAAVAAGGNVSLTATNITLGGGILSSTGSIVVNGNVTLSNNAIVRAGAGEDVTFNGPVTSANNSRLIVRGIGGGLDAVTFNGAVTGLGSFQVDGTAAASVNLGNVTATSMIVRGAAINVGGNLSVVDHGLGLPEGNLHLVGALTLTADSQLNYTASTTGRSVRVEGAITGGGNDLTINSGNGSVVMTGAVTGVANMDVTSTGVNYVTAPITVNGTFNWNSNGVAVLVLQDITAGSSPSFTVPPRLLNGATLNP